MAREMAQCSFIHEGRLSNEVEHFLLTNPNPPPGRPRRFRGDRAAAATPPLPEPSTPAAVGGSRQPADGGSGGHLLPKSKPLTPTIHSNRASIGPPTPSPLAPRASRRRQPGSDRCRAAPLHRPPGSAAGVRLLSRTSSSPSPSHLLTRAPVVIRRGRSPPAASTRWAIGLRPRPVSRAACSCLLLPAAVTPTRSQHAAPTSTTSRPRLLLAPSIRPSSRLGTGRPPVHLRVGPPLLLNQQIEACPGPNRPLCHVLRDGPSSSSTSTPPLTRLALS
nr:uncharacterized protein LOC127304229 [Lolium perenne]